MRCRAGFILAILAGAVCGSAHGQDTDDLEPIAADELAKLRGGYLVADGVSFDFAADILSTIDGQPVLVTRVVWTPNGVVHVDAAGQPVAAPPSGPAEIVIPGIGGATVLGHRLVDGQLLGVVLNSANGREIRQDLNVTLTLPGFAEIQQEMVQTLTGLQIGRDVADGLVRSSSPN